MKEDIVLKNKIKALIKREDRYLTAEEILSKLGIEKSRVYLSYRGVDITALNREIGFTRQVFISKRKKDPAKSKEDLENKMRELILEHQRYIPRSEFHKKFKIHDEWIGYYNINAHEINCELGFGKSSPMVRVDKDVLRSRILTYMQEKGTWVSQKEISDKFNVSTAYITKSGIDTISLNVEVGNSPNFNYFEELCVKSLLTLNVKKFERQKTFEDLRDRGLLRFDLFLPEFNCLIELDGPQHTDPSHRFYSENLVRRDELKNKYCLEKGIKLVRIPFIGKFKTTVQYISNKLLENLPELANYNVA